MKLEYHETAIGDLREIWEYYAKSRTGKAADKLLGQLIAHCGLLQVNPLLGRPRPDIAASVRSFPSGGYVIYYRVDSERRMVSIARILHGARDLSASAFSCMKTERAVA